jgi:hypothetical protein
VLFEGALQVVNCHFTDHAGIIHTTTGIDQLTLLVENIKVRRTQRT